jgi:aminoglycoside phosphotransferase (APT) family kinase protein
VSTDRVTDRELWRSVAATLRDVVAPGLPVGHELDTAVQLQGLAAYAASRTGDPAQERAGRLARALGAPPQTPPARALELASELLVHAVQEPAGGPARDRAAGVRAVLLEALEDDIAAAAPLLETFSGHPATDVPPADRRVPDAELAGLVAWFEDALGGPVAVDRAVVLSGGHSRRMLRLDLAGPAGPESFVVRIEQGGTFGTDGTVEARAMQALAAAGVPVAPVRWVEPRPEPLGQPFFVMDLVPGASAVDDRVLETFLGVLDGVHHVDPAVLADVLGPVPDPQEAVLAQLDRWTGVYRESVRLPVPLLEEAAAWLRGNLRPTGPVAVVHGDPGPGNFLHRDGVISALTDWEFVHYGDAAEDWAYFATIRSRKLKSADAWYAHIERAVGVRNDPATWRAWEAFNQFKGACANLTALRLFRDGTATTPNLLAIGTAVHYRFLRQLADLVG